MKRASLFLWIPCVTALVACAALVLHSPHLTRQVDVQHIEYAFDFLRGLSAHDISSSLFFPKKYPLFSVVPLSFLYALILSALKIIGLLPSLSASDVSFYFFTNPWEIYIATRLVTVFFGILLLVLLSRTSRKLFPDTSPMYAVLLMLSSMMFLTLVTSMRQHVPAACLIFLTFMFSLSLAEKKTTQRLLLAFGSATLSFCVLQNGLFSYIFPLYAYASVHNALQWRRWLHPRLLGVFLGSIFLATIFGYPFLWRDLFVRHIIGFGLGNEDIGQSPWGFSGFGVLLRTLLGSEIFLVVFTALTLYRAYRGRVVLHPYLWSVALFCSVYIVFFGFVGWTTPRYFLPLSPFLALFGGVSLPRARFTLYPFVLLLSLIHLQFAVLALSPDTYDLTREFLLTKTTGSITGNVPHYFLDIPPTREGIGDHPTMQKERFIRTLSEDLPSARTFLPLSSLSGASVFVHSSAFSQAPDSDWTACFEAISSKNHDRMFLWSELEWAYYWIFRTQYLGPNITVYCRSLQT